MGTTMNGAESLVRTLLAGGVNVCFTNPGTSEMHFVAALDKVPGMRCVLGLFEGVVTGAADGYYRMLGRPASTLLHLGARPGQRARQPAQRQEGQLRHRQHCR
jgi:acetolactate synthase-1/2/3 large subunit